MDDDQGVLLTHAAPGMYFWADNFWFSKISLSQQMSQVCFKAAIPIDMALLY